MRHLEHLGTLVEAQNVRRAVPKHALATKLDRAVAKKIARQMDEKQLAAWALAVKERDGWKDRYTDKKVKRTMDLDPLRGESHHCEPRENEDTRYDVRNGLCLSFETHDAVERHRLLIVGTKYFSLNGKRYIDCTYPVRFRKVIA